MTTCSPQRYLANDRNLVRAATLTPSSVLPVENSVRELPVARDGTGQVILSGAYTGQESANFDVQILDNSIDVPLISSPVFSGAGSGTLANIAATTPQTYTVQLQNVGLPTLSSGIDFEGVRIIARSVGAAGNGITIDVDQTSLTFTLQNFSLLDDLKKGDGGESSGIQGAAFDWDTKVLGIDDQIPTSAHRVAFGDDKGDIYLQYKEYDGVNWVYHFVPELKRDIPKGTRISFVTGGRTVTVTPLIGSPETFTDVETVYDLLNDFFTGSALVSVLGVIANDRSPTGQASKELAIRTDAHCEPSTGTGSGAALGFEDTFANSNASTELVVATCFAVTSTDHPLARLGAERWRLKGSVSGDMGEIVTNIPFVQSDDKFGLTIPQRLPDGYGTQRGRFTLVPPINYMPRVDPAEPPPICPVALTLGTEAVDQTITLVWTKRPTGNCLCAGMPIPTIGGPCLGIFPTEGGDGMGYQSDTVTKLVSLYDYTADTIASLSSIAAPSGDATGRQGNEDPVLVLPVADNVLRAPETFQRIIASFESYIKQIDAVLDTGLRAAGMSAWDDAVDELKVDVTDLLVATAGTRFSLRDDLYRARLNAAIMAAGISPLGKTDASIIESGDGCWRDMGGDYWTVSGSLKGAYAPLFNNTVYYSCRLSTDGKAYFSTHEFGLQVNIKCPQDLIYGDEIVLSIGDAGWGATYAVGDELTLPIIAAQSQTLAGGQDGNADLVFYVTGAVDGSLPNFIYSPSASPVADTYSQMGLSFQYRPGGVPNQAGDSFTFTVEGGHWRYRRNGGSWITGSPPADIDTTPQAFVDGLSIAFQTGAYPSFVPTDIYSFNVAQPYAVSNLQTPNRYQWKWNEAGPNLVVDLGSAQQISMIALARHTIPHGATVTVEFGTSVGVYTHTETLAWSSDAIANEFPVQTARYLRLTLTGSANGGIGWMFAGVALRTSLSADIDLRLSYKINSNASGLSQGGRYLGKAKSGSITWKEAAMNEEDYADVKAMVDWVKMHDDEPIVIMPQVTRPNEAYAALIAVDEIDLDESSKFNRDVAFDRRYSATLPLAGAWR